MASNEELQFGGLPWWVWIAILFGLVAGLATEAHKSRGQEPVPPGYVELDLKAVLDEQDATYRNAPKGLAFKEKYHGKAVQLLGKVIEVRAIDRQNGYYWIIPIGEKERFGRAVMCDVEKGFNVSTPLGSGVMVRGKVYVGGEFWLRHSIAEPLEVVVKASEQAAPPGRMMVEFVQDDCPFCGAMEPVVEQAQRKGYDIRVVNLKEPVVAGTKMSGVQMAHAYFGKIGVPEAKRTTPAFFVLDRGPGGGLINPRLVRATPADFEAMLARQGVAKATPRPAVTR